MKRKAKYHFLVHEKEDNVGVAVVDIEAGKKLKGLIMTTNENIELGSMMDIPLGHKIALTNIEAGNPIIKYGHDIGKAVAKIKKSEHVHVHNVKTRRW